MYRSNRDREREKHSFRSTGFRQRHGGRDRFPGGEWGSSSEFGKNTNYREADSYDREKERSFDSGGADFDRDERDDDSYDREYNRSRFAEPYTGGQFSRSQYGTGGLYNSDRFDHSSRGYGQRDAGFSGKGPKGYKRSDEKIREEVCEILFRNPMVDASDIEVKVQEGLVILSGTVDSRFAKREAENAIENLTGVVDVQNELRLTNASSDIVGKDSGFKGNNPEH